MIHLSMPISGFFGAGNCGRYLAHEFSKKGVALYNTLEGEQPASDVDGPLVQFTGPELEQQTRYRGNPNVAYLFSEWDITEKQKENLKAFDVLIAGSEWNAQVIRNSGLKCHAVPQGVDTSIFKPLPRARLKDRLVIFSGGKWEHRKAQDLVIRAVSRLKDVVLMASWFNIWENADHYEEAAKAGIKLIGLPMLEHEDLAWHMNQTDFGLFPNRCEGGTNLVMMEYLACGKPVIANTSTGQKDVLDDSYSIGIEGDDDSLVEQMISGIDHIKTDMGANAAEAMKFWTWSRTAEGIERAWNT